MAVAPIGEGGETMPGKKPGKPWRRRWWWRGLKGLAAVLLLLVLVVAVYLLVRQTRVRSRLAETLPVTQGELKLPGLSAPVRIERDALGVPTLRAANRVDLARALGFVHAQDRFFQMDLVMRRRGTGELSGLMGPLARSWDLERRPYRLRALAQRIVAELPPDERALLDAYTAGVNAGLAALPEPPFEYVVLHEEPRPWLPEDSILAVLTMFQNLQNYTRQYELDLGLMKDVLPPALYDFVNPQWTEWDSPMEGEPGPPVPIPRPDQVDFRKSTRTARLDRDRLGEPGPFEERILGGSSSWAIDGRHTASGGALLANDVHLALSVPNIWYRASFVWPGEDGSENRVTGVTLPGVPVMVIGSNRHVAWGFTSSLVDTSDVIVVDVDPKDPEVYRTPEGPKRFEHHSETIDVNLWGDERIESRWTVWGPVIGEDHKGRPLALRWVVYEPGAVNFSSYRLETAKTLEEALDAANRGGAPAQNFLVADRTGRIGWTIMGRIPRRIGFDGMLPGSWADGTRRWEGLMPPGEVPRIVDPPSGRLWNANNAPVAGEKLARLGDGGYRSGARALQIRNSLFALPKATERDMLAIQLDDRALFLERWHRLLKSVLTPEAVAGNPRRSELRDLVQRWEGHASVDSVSYRLVRSFRFLLAEQLGDTLLAACREVDPAFSSIIEFGHYESPVWQLASQRPPHLLDPKFQTWDEQLLAGVDATLDFYDNLDDGVPLSERTWGQANTTAIQHPLSPLMPLSSGWLNMPSRQLPGDAEMPLVQLPAFGATFRMAVSPGREEQGFFHMPDGTSGHPRSRHYRDGHSAWEEGKPTPFLPGPAVDVLTLRP